MPNLNEETKINQLISEARSLKNQVSSKTQYFAGLLSQMSSYSSTKAHLGDCIGALNKIYRSLEDFMRNYEDMKRANTINADKYFHAKANCQAAQKGDIGVAVAKWVSDLREFTDSFRNITEKGMSIKASFEDMKNDQEANRYGHNRGKNNPNAACRDLVNKYRPNGLHTKY